jgi:hypothetical protein
MAAYAISNVSTNIKSHDELLKNGIVSLIENECQASLDPKRFSDQETVRSCLLIIGNLTGNKLNHPSMGIFFGKHSFGYAVALMAYDDSNTLHHFFRLFDGFHTPSRCHVQAARHFSHWQSMFRAGKRQAFNQRQVHGSFGGVCLSTHNRWFNQCTVSSHCGSSWPVQTCTYAEGDTC